MSLLKYAFFSDTLASNLKLCSCPKAKFFPEIFILGSVEPKGNFRGYLAPLSVMLLVGAEVGTITLENRLAVSIHLKHMLLL